MSTMKKIMIAMIASLMMVVSVAPVTASTCGVPYYRCACSPEARNKGAIRIVVQDKAFYNTMPRRPMPRRH